MYDSMNYGQSRVEKRQKKKSWKSIHFYKKWHIVLKLKLRVKLPRITKRDKIESKIKFCEQLLKLKEYLVFHQ